MSKQAINRVLAVYLAVASAISAVWLLATPGMVGWRWGVIIGTFGGYLIFLLLFSGILPLIFWAFGRFRAEKAGGPIISWGFLAAMFAFLATMGNAYDGSLQFSAIPQNVAGFFDNDYQALVRDIRFSCVQTQNKNRSAGITSQQIDQFCQCSAETFVKDLSGPEYVAAVSARSTSLPTWARQKAANAGSSCRRNFYGR
jgi:hypothetical protein